MIDRKIENTPVSLDGLIDELLHLDETVRVGLDVVGGITGLAEAMLADASFALVHVSGLAVNRTRQGTVGGEHKSDPRDARVIADQVRTRQDLRAIEPMSELDLELRLLAKRRRDLVAAQTQRLARMHDLLVSIFSGLESILDMRLNKSLVLPDRVRHAGGAAGCRQRTSHALPEDCHSTETRGAGRARPGGRHGPDNLRSG